ncbi:MAG: 30S ribosomal protein S9 [Phycisphaerae bacterium]|nr:30S ribosomal protein S9 [Phycisphaerae bacterium]
MSDETKPVQEETASPEEAPAPQAEATEKKPSKPKAEAKEKKSARPKADAKDKKPDAAEASAEETKAPKAKKEAPAEEPKPSRTAPPLPEGVQFIWGTGRRKSAIARVRIRPGDGAFLINKRDVADFFPHLKDQNTVFSPLEALGMRRSYEVNVNLKGGGWTGQSGAVALGLARALAKHMPEIERDLRHKGLLTRDARAKERKKPGQPGARKRFQFSKR